LHVYACTLPLVPVNETPRTGHEVVPENHSQTPFRSHPRSTPQRPACRVSNAGRKQVDPDKALQEELRKIPYLTGRYVEAHGRYNLFINQAGKHIECLLALIVTGLSPKVGKFNDERIEKAVARFSGDWDDASDSFDLYAGFDPDDRLGVLGTEDDKGKELRLVFFEDAAPPVLSPIVNTTASKTDDQPALFERYLAPDIVPSVFRTYHWFALTPQQVKFLESDFVADLRDDFNTNLGQKHLGIEGLVAHYFEQNRKAIPFVRSLINKTNAEAIDAFFLKLKSYAFSRSPQDGGLHESHFDTLVMVTRFKLSLLSMRPAPDALEDTLDRLIERICNENASMSGKHVREFGFNPTTPKNVIEIEFTVDGGEAKVIFGSAGAWVGTITLKKIKGATFSPKDGRNEVTFPLALSSYGVGLEFGVSTFMNGKGTATSAHEWLSEHIPGPCTAEGVSADAAVGAGVGLNLSGMQITGNPAAGAPHFPLAVIFDLPKNVKDAMTFGLGASVGVKILRGQILPEGAKPPTQADAAALLPSTSNAEYLKFLNEKKQIHYCTNDAQLTEDAKRFIATVAALELPALQSSAATFEIKGYADREGKAGDNEVLALARAANVGTHLFDLLTVQQDRGLIEAKIKTFGKGEFVHGPDHVSNPNFRRVEMVLNGTMVLVLTGVPDGLPTGTGQ